MLRHSNGHWEIKVLMVKTKEWKEFSDTKCRSSSMIKLTLKDASKGWLDCIKMFQNKVWIKWRTNPLNYWIMNRMIVFNFNIKHFGYSGHDVSCLKSMIHKVFSLIESKNINWININILLRPKTRTKFIWGSDHRRRNIF